MARKEEGERRRLVSETSEEILVRELYAATVSQKDLYLKTETDLTMAQMSLPGGIGVLETACP